VSCIGCRDGDPFPVEFTMAFQPIVDMNARTIWGYEALVRGVDGQGAGAVLSSVTASNMYRFDQACRVKAIEIAGAKMDSRTAKLSINFMPNAVYEPKACIRATLAAAAKVGFDPKRLMFEFTENERISDAAHVERIVAEYRQMGFMTALDDFGAGYAGLGLLTRLQPDILKLDMELIRDIDASPAKRAIVSGLVKIADDLGLTLLGEGVETSRELAVLRDLGIRLFQGFLFGKPELERFVCSADIVLPTE